MRPQRIGIAGAGIGGLSAAIALRKFGFDVRVYEQANRFAKVGADVNLTPNAVAALDGLGIGPALRETAARPAYRISRMWDTGEITSRIEMADAAVSRYGSPQLTMHRADVLDALRSVLPNDAVWFGKRLTEVQSNPDGARLAFADGTVSEVDVVLGADGIHSAVRAGLIAPDDPSFTGMVAYRAVVSASRLSVPNMDSFTKWWGPDPDTQVVTFPLNRGNDMFVFATIRQDDWRYESWTIPGHVEELRDSYRDFHPEARAVLESCDEVVKSALCIREPLTQWSDGRVTLLGDACHPMMPFMAQGAGMAIEDAVVLARALGESEAYDVAEAWKVYEGARKDRTS